MNKNILMTGLFINFSLLFSGCATLIDGGYTQEIHINSKKDVLVNVYKVDTKRNLTDEEKNKKVDNLVLIQSNVKVPIILGVNRDDRDIIIKPLDSHCKEIRVQSSENNTMLANATSGKGLPLSTTLDAITRANWEYDNNVNLDCW